MEEAWKKGMNVLSTEDLGSVGKRVLWFAVGTWQFSGKGGKRSLSRSPKVAKEYHGWGVKGTFLGGWETGK